MVAQDFLKVLAPERYGNIYIRKHSTIEIRDRNKLHLRNYSIFIQYPPDRPFIIFVTQAREFVESDLKLEASSSKGGGIATRNAMFFQKQHLFPALAREVAAERPPKPAPITTTS